MSRITPTEKELLAKIYKEVIDKFSPDREYIIVCNEHRGIFPGALLFWGHKTENNKKRSFGGYTSDINGCEIYTLEEIKEKNYRFPVYEEGMSFHDFLKLDDVIIKKTDLLKFEELKTMKIVYRP